MAYYLRITSGIYIMNQRINRKAIIIGILLVLVVAWAGRKAGNAWRENETCKRMDQQNEEPKSQADFYVLEAISHQVLMSR